MYETMKRLVTFIFLIHGIFITTLCRDGNSMIEEMVLKKTNNYKPLCLYA